LAAGLSPKAIQAGEAGEQVSTQLWGDLLLRWPQSDIVALDLDLRPKGQISGGEPWRELWLRGRAFYYPSAWADAIGELVFSLTRQTEDLTSSTVSVRVGSRLHVLSQIARMQGFERVSSTRHHLTALMRLEFRTFNYSDDRLSSNDWRFRLRPEFKIAFNRPSLSDDQTLFGVTDYEWFIPLGDEAAERFATRGRFRVGLGYRFDYTWRLELYYIRDSSRDRTEEELTNDANIVNLKLKIFF
jgi:hypothetical protein